MKYIKTFEDSNKNIKIGDWAVVRNDSIASLQYFLNKPLEVVDAQLYPYVKLRCDISEIFFDITEIEYYSKNKEDVESFIQAKKYNL